MAATDSGVKGGEPVNRFLVAVGGVGVIAIIGLLAWWMSVRAGTIVQDQIYGRWAELGISPVGLILALPALLRCLVATFNLRLPALVLMAALTPFMVGRDHSEGSLADPAVLPFVRPGETLCVAVSILLILAVLVAAGFPFAAGRRQAAAANTPAGREGQETGPAGGGGQGQGGEPEEGRAAAAQGTHRECGGFAGREGRRPGGGRRVHQG